MHAIDLFGRYVIPHFKTTDRAVDGRSIWRRIAWRPGTPSARGATCASTRTGPLSTGGARPHRRGGLALTLRPEPAALGLRRLHGPGPAAGAVGDLAGRRPPGRRGGGDRDGGAGDRGAEDPPAHRVRPRPGDDGDDAGRGRPRHRQRALLGRRPGRGPTDPGRARGPLLRLHAGLGPAGRPTRCAPSGAPTGDPSTRSSTAAAGSTLPLGRRRAPPPRPGTGAVGRWWGTGAVRRL